MDLISDYKGWHITYSGWRHSAVNFVLECDIMANKFDIKLTNRVVVSVTDLLIAPNGQLAQDNYLANGLAQVKDAIDKEEFRPVKTNELFRRIELLEDNIGKVKLT